MHLSLALVGRRVAPLCLAVLIAGLSGCLTAEGTLDRDGTGALTLAYKVPAGMTEAAVRALLEAPGVTVESISLGADRMVTAKLKVTDLAGISKTKLLKDATVTHSAQGDDKTLTIAYTNPPGRGTADKNLPGPKIKITLPGPVTEANEKGVIDGSTVTWSVASLADWVGHDKWELVAHYRLPDAAGTAH